MATLDDIDHFVVLMLENRSFDNLFGRLYPGKADFAGLAGTETNPDAAGHPVPVWTQPDDPQSLWLPTPDPGERWDDINIQLYGSTPPGGIPAMNGFVRNYTQYAPEAARGIMHGFVPAQLPALAALAQSYAVCDHWYAAAPCQTWPNRFFVHTGTAGGYENNSPAHFPYLMETIFNRLDGVVPHGWRIYFHDFPQALTLSRLWYHLDHFSDFDDFIDDAARGTLPSYSFIEPRYFADLDWPNDMHPPHCITYGDQLVARIYNALRAGPNWARTLLLITFDEHGGCYDHIAPPAAPMPEPPRPGQAFPFDRFGVRVPAVAISPYIAPGTVFRATEGQPYDHTSIIQTLRRRFKIDTPLTARDAHAPDLATVLTLPTPSNTGPATVQALPAPASDDAAALQRARLAPLNDFQQALHTAAAHLPHFSQHTLVDAHINTLKASSGPQTAPATSAETALSSIRRMLSNLSL